MALEIGDIAPDFTLPDDTDQSVSLKQLRGKKVVLYFYPKDNTPGCTKEACDFRDNFTAFTKNDVEVFGISKDSVKTHTKFKQKHALPFRLLVDANADVCEAYGVVNKKACLVKHFRHTAINFLIDEKGIIRAIWRGVKVPGHVEQVLNELR